jgi:hypothetical protein
MHEYFERIACLFREKKHSRFSPRLHELGYLIPKLEKRFRMSS